MFETTMEANAAGSASAVGAAPGPDSELPMGFGFASAEQTAHLMDEVHGGMLHACDSRAVARCAQLPVQEKVRGKLGELKQMLRTLVDRQQEASATNVKRHAAACPCDTDTRDSAG